MSHQGRVDARTLYQSLELHQAKLGQLQDLYIPYNIKFWFPSTLMRSVKSPEGPIQPPIRKKEANMGEEVIFALKRRLKVNAVDDKINRERASAGRIILYQLTHVGIYVYAKKLQSWPIEPSVPIYIKRILDTRVFPSYIPPKVYSKYSMKRLNPSIQYTYSRFSAATLINESMHRRNASRAQL